MAKKEKVSKQDYQGDVLDMFRKLVGTVQMSDVKEFDALTGQDRINFLNYCNLVYGNPFFIMIIKHLIFEHVVKAAMESRDTDEMLVNRASANGVKITQDFFAKYHREFVKEFEKDPESFEKEKAFEPVPEE